MEVIEELRKDATELRGFLNNAQRNKVKDILGVELFKLESEISLKEKNLRQVEANESLKHELGIDKETEDSKDKVAAPPPTVKPKSNLHVPNTVLSTYAWDQSDKFMKIYASLDGVHKIDADNVTCEFGTRTFKLNVKNLNSRNYELYISTLSEDIVSSESYYKVKTDKVLIMLKKKESGKTWAYVTEREKKASDKKKPNTSDDKDPNDSMMDLLKNMYDEGDDEMKRTIAKAMSESRNKTGMM